jgi:hypothetical protein
VRSVLAESRVLWPARNERFEFLNVVRQNSLHRQIVGYVSFIHYVSGNHSIYLVLIDTLIKPKYSNANRRLFDLFQVARNPDISFSSAKVSSTTSVLLLHSSTHDR